MTNSYWTYAIINLSERATEANVPSQLFRTKDMAERALHSELRDMLPDEDADEDILPRYLKYEFDGQLWISDSNKYMFNTQVRLYQMTVEEVEDEHVSE